MTVAILLASAVRSTADDQEKKDGNDAKPTIVYPIAIFAFEERGAVRQGDGRQSDRYPFRQASGT